MADVAGDGLYESFYFKNSEPSIYPSSPSFEYFQKERLAWIEHDRNRVRSMFETKSSTNNHIILLDQIRLFGKEVGSRRRLSRRLFGWDADYYQPREGYDGKTRDRIPRVALEMIAYYNELMKGDPNKKDPYKIYRGAESRAMLIDPFIIFVLMAFVINWGAIYFLLRWQANPPKALKPFFPSH